MIFSGDRGQVASRVNVPDGELMKIMITGSEGLVGRAVAELLLSHDHRVVGYDSGLSSDILNLDLLTQRTQGCDAIIHCAALLGQPHESSTDVMTVNRQGTWHVLEAARVCAINKLVFLSSVDVLGIFKGQRAPDYLPIDDDHRCYPSTPYAMSKYLSETLARQFARDYDASVICLRPPGVWNEETYAWIEAERSRRESFEWNPFWEYGAFIDVRDLARACLAALESSLEGFHRLLVTANDITTSGRTSIELCRMIHPHVPWRGGEVYEDEPFRTLLCNDEARQLLNWEPVHSWRGQVENPRKPSAFTS